MHCTASISLRAQAYNAIELEQRARTVLYTATLLRDFEEALEPNAYRVRHLADNDGGYEYDLSPEHHAAGCYEIEIAIEKITPPSWKLD